MEDIETILDTLVYDGKVEKTITASANTSSERGADQVWLYRTLTPLIPPTGLMRMPCGVCPIFNECCDDGIVSPTKCIYMKEWLDL
ncbi:hypothetical protein LSH36_137g04046 [Paralvinella palmiformis]|uniref:DNA-directed RNA polymerase III subunit RPC6 n=1 Tax=Paralvinella palmiformis TaxID=53620 RepID=A0AAD9NAN8_9ANNE|nr:hypothetical protein LSH36_137g04046 [Paralvinella palmiformis]